MGRERIEEKEGWERGERRRRSELALDSDESLLGSGVVEECGRAGWEWREQV